MSETVKTAITYLLQLVTGYLPQGLSFVLFIYAFCRQRIDRKRFVLSVGVMFLVIWLTRNLPVNFGVHTLLNMLALIGLSCGVCGLRLEKTVVGCLLATVVMFCTEALNVAVLWLILGRERTDALLTDSLIKALLVIPSMVLFTLGTVIFYLLRTRSLRVPEKERA